MRMEAAVDFHPNLHQRAAAGTSNFLALGQRMLHHHLVQMLRGAYKQFQLVQLQLLHQQWFCKRA